MDTAKHELSEESGNGKRRLRKRGLNKSNKNSEPKEEEQKVEAEYSKLKSSICCPPNILNVLLAQTEMTEGQIHVEYMKFKNEYPTGYVGPHVLRNLCINIMNEEDCDYYVESVFKLYGERKKGWAAKLLGFREVILATESIPYLNQPDKVLRWLFRVYDPHGKGEIPIGKIEPIVVSILDLCVKLKTEETIEDLSIAIMEEFDMNPYDDDMISEEEFVYDCLNNRTLFHLLQNSLKTYVPDNLVDSSDDEEASAEISAILRNKK